MSQSLFVTILTPQKMIFRGEIASMTSVNDKGTFDILDQHANFISTVRDYLLLITKDGQKEQITFTDGVVEVFENQVKVFLGLGKYLEEKKLANQSKE